MKWEIERRPGAFASDPCYYKVRLNGNFVISFKKLKNAKKFIEIQNKYIEMEDKK